MNINYNSELEKNKLILKTLKLIEKLSKNNIADFDFEDESIKEVKNSIITAREIVKNPHFSSFLE